MLPYQWEVLCWLALQGITQLLVVLTHMHQIHLQHTVVLHQLLPARSKTRQQQDIMGMLGTKVCWGWKVTLVPAFKVPSNAAPNLVA